MARILVADDDEGIRSLMLYLLAQDGHELAEATNGREAVDLVRAESPDLMILDIMMPEVDGYAVLRSLADDNLLEKVRVLVVTAKGTEGDFKLGYDLGADLYATKPFDPDELMDMVHELLGASREELEARRKREQERSNLLATLESVFEEKS